MDNCISFVETEVIEEKIQKILRQTNYSKELAKSKLLEYNLDEIDVIKSYLGINKKKTRTNKVFKSRDF